MKYVCLIYDQEKTWAEMDAPARDAVMAEYGTFSEDLEKSGQFIAGEELQPVETATSIRVRNGKMSTTDGPFAETREQLGAFFLIEARDLNEAIQLAARIPTAKTGTVEVRPVVDWSQS